MKKSLLSLVLCGSLAFAGSAWALTITGGIDVGVQDTKLAESVQIDNPTNELIWVKSILGNNITFDVKDETPEGAGWKQTNQSGTWAYNLTDSPDYFIIKTGKVTKTGADYRDFLFTNNASPDWAVIALGDILVTDVLNIAKVSHISEFDASDTPVPPSSVPEPGTLLLLGAGIGALGLFRRVKRS